MRISKGMVFAVMGAVIVLVGVATYLASTFADNAVTSRAVARKSRVTVETVRSVLALVQDAETGQRGFLITQDPSYLEPYEHARVAMPEALDRLRALTAGDPRQSGRVGALASLIDDKFGELQTTIALGRNEGFAAARQIILTDAGKMTMDRIRQDIAELLDTDLARFDENADRSAAQERQAFYAWVIGTLCAVLALVFSLAQLSRNYRRLAEAEGELAAKADVLQATLDNVRDGIAAFDGSGRLVASNERFFGLLHFPSSLRREGESLAAFLERDRARQPSLLTPLVASAVTPGDGSDPVAAGEPAGPVRASFEGAELELYANPMPRGGLVMAALDVTARVRADSMMREAQRMEAVGQLTGGLAHDFNNLLQVVAASLELLRDEAVESARQTLVDQALGAVGSGARLTRQLLAFARRQPLQPRSIDAGRLLADMGEMLGRTLGSRIVVRTVIAPGLTPVMADVTQLESAILNLGLNARDAMPDGGDLTIESANAEISTAFDGIEPGRFVVIAVTDTGYGMPKEVMARAFDPFFSTKEEGRGTGLGLSMVYGFAKQSGGYARIYSEPAFGTTVKIYLPAASEPVMASAPATAMATPTGSERVLVVEDDPNVRRTTVAMLGSLGYRVVAAGDAEAALAVLAADPGIDMMVSDVVMPGKLGVAELAARVADLAPGIAVLFVSGYAKNATLADGRLVTGGRLLSKPFGRDELAREVRQALDARSVLSPSVPGSLVATADGRPGTRGPVVLVVEDEAIIRLGTLAMLRDLGFAVEQAGDAAEALAALDRHPAISVMLTDLGLPDMSGEDLTLAARQRRPDLGVIFCSGATPKAGNGAEIYLVKPFDTDALRAAMERVMPANGKDRVTTFTPSA